MKRRFIFFIVLLFICFSLYAKKHRIKIKVNINQAHSYELVKLPGIGPIIAKRIIEYRKKTGCLKSLKILLK